MTFHIRAWRPAFFLAVALLMLAAAPASAASLRAGEYACAGSGGRILIGLGFILRGDGTYTDLDGKSHGRVVFSGTTVKFVGGHLGGYVGINLRDGTNFDLKGHGISCSHN
jgi:hypothetical protein